MKKLLVLMAVLALLPQVASAKRHSTRTTTMTTVTTEQRIPMQRARDIALQRYQGAHVRGQRYEQLGGRFVYGFDLSVPRERGYTVVLVDPKSGDVLFTGTEHRKSEWRHQKNWDWSNPSLNNMESGHMEKGHMEQSSPGNKY